jgi:hypothetical protein
VISLNVCSIAQNKTLLIPKPIEHHQLGRLKPCVARSGGLKTGGGIPVGKGLGKSGEMRLNGVFEIQATFLRGIKF